MPFDRQVFCGFLRLSAATAAVMAAAPQAQAQAPADGVAVAAIGSVTVYGTRNARESLTFPGMITVIDSAEIETRQPSSISDLLRDVPGVEFSGGPRRTGEAPSIRGLGGQRVLILVDGVRQSFTSAHDGRFFLDPALLKTAEIVRGPSSALYGSGALGGVLGFETVDAADLLGAGETAGMRVRAGVQSVNDEVLIAGTAFARAGGFDGVLSIGRRHSGDIRLGNGFDLTSNDDIVTGLAKASYTGDDVDVTLAYQRFHNEAVEPNNGQGITSTDPILAQILDKTTETEQWRAELNWRPGNGNWIDLRIIPYRVDTKVEEQERVSPRRVLRDITTTGITVENRARFALGETLSALLTVGFETYEDEQIGRDSAGAGGVREGVPNGAGRFEGFYAQIEAAWQSPLGLPGELLVIPGIRHDSFESEATGQPGVSDSSTSLKFAASYTPVDWLTLFANWSEGLRAPGINELYLSGIHFRMAHPHPVPRAAGVTIANSFVPNPNLRPEKAESVELGAAVNVAPGLFADDRFTVKGVWWQADVDDFIDLTVNFGFPATCFIPPFYAPCNAGTTNAANIATAELDGIELEAEYDTPRLRLALSYGGVDGRNARTGAFLGTLTPDRYTADARLKLPEIGAFAGARVQHADAFTEVNTATERRARYTVVDVYAAWAPESGPLAGLRIDVGVDNVTDNTYDRVFAGVAEPGRNVKAAISYALAW